MRQFALILFLTFFSYISYAQTDDMLLLEESSKVEKSPVIATFKTTKLVNAVTIEQVKKGELDFRISHRFDDIGGTAGGIKTLYGFDNVTDIRISFDYGITDKLCVGFARSKGAYLHRQILDFSFKGKLIQQQSNGFPFGISLFGASTISTMQTSADINDVTYFKEKFTHRMTHNLQLIFARKFSSRVSLEILPTYIHRNLVKYNDSNGLFALGFGGRVKFTKRMGIIFDYYQVFDKLHTTSNGYYAPLGVGLELETGGHVFHLLFSNNKSLLESQFLTENKDRWLKGQFRFGFNISRTFNIN